MPYLNTDYDYRYEWKSSWDEGYIADRFDYCHKCDPELYPVWVDENCLKYKFRNGKPKCKKCEDGYSRDRKNYGYCVKDFECLFGTVEINSTCVGCSELIENCVYCDIVDSQVTCSQCAVDYVSDSNNRCVPTSCTNNFISLDGTQCVDEWFENQYVQRSSNKCMNCTIANWNAWYEQNEMEVWYECGLNTSNNQTFLKSDLSIWVDQCASFSKPDLGNRWISAPANTVDFDIIEQPWNILNQLKKNITPSHPHSLNSTECEAMYYLIEDTDNSEASITNQNSTYFMCSLWDIDKVYDSKSNQCVECTQYCVFWDQSTNDTCQTCLSNSPFKLNGKWYKQCPKGWYGDVDNQCKLCDDACGGELGSCTAAGSANCNGCEFNPISNTFVTYLVTGISHCATPGNCPNGTYPNIDGRYARCTEGCISCTGPNGSDCEDDNTVEPDCIVENCRECSSLNTCFKCEATFELNIDGQCDKVSNPGQYADPNKVCQTCHSDCVTCTDGSTCTQCQQRSTTSHYVGVNLTEDGQCVYEQCPDNCAFCEFALIEDDTLSCSCCFSDFTVASDGFLVEDSTISDTQIWLPGERKINNCCITCLNSVSKRWYTNFVFNGNGQFLTEIPTACKPGYYLDYGQWLKRCPDGYFADKVLHWCVRYDWDCEKCEGTKENWLNECTNGEFNTQNRRWEIDLSQPPTITSDITTNTIDVILPVCTRMFNSIKTNFFSDGIYNNDAVWEDAAYNDNWNEILENEQNIVFFKSNLKSRLSSDEQNEIDTLLEQDYSAETQRIIDEGLLADYRLDKEGEIGIFKLIAYYRFSILGISDLIIPFDFIESDFYTELDAAASVCEFLLHQETIFEIESQTCSFTILDSRELKITISVNDLSTISSTLDIKFNDVFYCVNENIMGPISMNSLNMPTLITEVELSIIILIPETITTCEYLSINYMNSQGLGSNHTINITLQALEITQTEEFVTTNLSAYQELFDNAVINAQKQMVEMSSRVLMIDKAVMALFENYTLYILYTFTNEQTRETQSSQTTVDVVFGIRYETSDLNLVIDRTDNTTINTVTKVDCNANLETVLEDDFEWLVYVMNEDSSGTITTIIDESVKNCVIDPNIIDINMIMSIKVNDTFKNTLTNVPYSFEQVQCSCDINTGSSSYTIQQNITLDSLWCSENYILAWQFEGVNTNESVTFNTTINSFSATDYLMAGSQYATDIRIYESRSLVQYGECSGIIEIYPNTSDTIDTQLLSTSKNNPNTVTSLRVISTDENDVEVEPETVEMVLVEEDQIGNTTAENLLETSFSNSHQIIDNTTIQFDPDAWKQNVTYVLTAVVTRGDVIGKAVKKIIGTKADLFKVRVSHKNITTGDDIIITITSKTSTCLKCVLGHNQNDQLDPFWIMTNPNKLCGIDQIKEVTTKIPLMTDDNAEKAELFVMCIPNSETEATDLKRIKLMVINKQLSTNNIAFEVSPRNDKERDRICLSVLSLPDNVCPPDGFRSICTHAIQRKWDQLNTFEGDYQKMWKKFSNMLIYSLIRTITCTNETFADNIFDAVETILHRICESLAKEPSICTAEEIETISCNTFGPRYINKILKILINFRQRMTSNPTYDTLQTVLDHAGRLVQCSFSSNLNSDSATEVSSDDGNIIAFFRISQLNEVWSGHVTEKTNTTLRRALENAKNAWGIVFDRLPDSIANQSNLLLTIRYNNNCSNYNTSICNSQDTISYTPKCCEISVGPMYMDSSGSINVRELQIDSSQNGQGTLILPIDSCNENVRCAYYDENNQCWSYDGLTSSDDCSTCTTTHFSTFAFVSRTVVETSDPISEWLSEDNCQTEPITTEIRDF